MIDYDIGYRISMPDRAELEKIAHRLNGNEIISLPKRRAIADQLNAIIKRTEFIPNEKTNGNS